MDVLIKGMEMPKMCLTCPACQGDECWAVEGRPQVPDILNVRPKWCPLVPVPTPHGRLKDADALEELVIKEKYACEGASAYGAISELHKSWGLHKAELMIEAAPTIIEAEGE